MGFAIQTTLRPRMTTGVLKISTRMHQCSTKSTLAMDRLFTPTGYGTDGKDLVFAFSIQGMETTGSTSRCMLILTLRMSLKLCFSNTVDTIPDAVVHLRRKVTDQWCISVECSMVHTTPTAMADAHPDNSFPTLKAALSTWSFVKVGVGIGMTLGVLDYH